MIVRYYNLSILRECQFKKEDLWVENGKIIPGNRAADLHIDAGGALAAPGYIDLQINGAFGVDFTSEPARWTEAAEQLLQYGVTAFLPTVVSSERDHYRQIIPKLQPSHGFGASNLGIHLEGPFLNVECAGAHERSVFKNPADVPSLVEFYGSLEGVKMVTLAPELPGGMNCLEELRKKNIIPAAGHTQISFEGMIHAFDRGCRMVTHLFNAMPSFHHRNPGIVGAALGKLPLRYSLIADLLHVHEAGIRIAWSSNPGGMVLVTDAMSGAGLAPGDYHLGKVDASVDGRKAVLRGTDTLAGSVLMMDQAVRNLKQATGCSDVEAIEAATRKPAEALGIYPNKGSLDIGADADFIFLSPGLVVEETYIAGKLYPK